MVDTIFDKLGLYDVVAVLLSGVIIVYLSIIFLNIYFEDFMKLNVCLFELDMVNLFGILIISFLVGIVFQELGSVLFRYYMFKNDRMLKDVFKESEDKSTSLTLKEKCWIEKNVKNKWDLEENENDYEVNIYNCCKYFLIKNGDMKNADKNQSISALSRSLFIYFFLSGFLFLGIGACKSYIRDVKYICVIIISFLLAYVLFKRSVRFCKMRYVNILRMFCYDINNRREV